MLHRGYNLVRTDKKMTVVDLHLQNREQVKRAFPPAVHDDIDHIFEILRDLNYPIHFFRDLDVDLNGTRYPLLARCHFDPLHTSNGEFLGSTRWTLTPQQLNVMACILSCDAKGATRLEYVGRLLDCPQDFSIPYLLAQIADYVVVIPEVILARFDLMRDERKSRILEFSNRNPKLIALLSARIVSHWDRSYRTRQFRVHGLPTYHRLSRYPSYILMQRLGIWPNKMGWKLLKNRKLSESEFE